ncbi:hypothetical protein Ddc_14476 [Ditylenchus destructor]|nr:hypothetical protein Ddc_14476 [Ditylenchus destructor]
MGRALEEATTLIPLTYQNDRQNDMTFSSTSKFSLGTSVDPVDWKKFRFLLQKARVLIDQISPNTGLFYTACQYCIAQKESDSLMFVLEQLLEVEKCFQDCDSSLFKLHGTEKETPLHAVVRAFSPETSQKLVPIMQLLLDAGAPLLAKDSNNETCLELLQKYLKNDHVGQFFCLGKFMSLKQIAAARLRCVLISANDDCLCVIKGLLPQQLWDYLQIF